MKPDLPNGAAYHKEKAHSSLIIKGQEWMWQKLQTDSTWKKSTFLAQIGALFIIFILIPTFFLPARYLTLNQQYTFLQKLAQLAPKSINLEVDFIS